jgi:Ribbon-helix-helix domain
VPKDRKFVNPLTQPSELIVQPSTSSSTLPATETATSPDTFTYTYNKTTQRKRGAQAFERTHERITLWIDRDLKQQFEVLANEQGTSKSGLLDEAIADLLAKYYPVAPTEQKQLAPIAMQGIRKPAEEEVQPPAATPQDDLVSLQLFADLHTVNRNEATRLWNTGLITGNKQGTGRQQTIMLDAKGQRDFWVQFHETQGFRACDDCPHV